MTREPHDPSPHDPLGVNLEIELTLEHEGQLYVLRPGLQDPEFDEFLETLGASSWIFLAFGQPTRKRRKRKAHDEALASVHAQLASSTILGGGLRSRKAQDEPEAGVFVLGLPRARARELAKQLGLGEFYWGSIGVPVEIHPAPIFGIDKVEETSRIETARVGLRDLAKTVGQVLRNPWAFQQQIGSDFGSLVVNLGLLLSVGVAAIVLSPGLASSADELTTQETTERLVSLLLHPVLLPAFLLARYLRRHYYTGSLKNPARELSAQETLGRWEEMRLHLLAVWFVAGIAIFVLSAARLLRESTLSATELVDDSSTYLAVCIWILTPLAFSKDVSQAISTIIGGAIAVFLTVLFMKLSLLITNWASGLLWMLVGKLIPFELPAFIMGTVDTVLAISAELFFLAHLLGYTWLKERTQFALRASGEI